MDIFKNSDFFVRARKQRTQNRCVYIIHEDSSTTLTQLSRKKCIFRGVLVFLLPLCGLWFIGQGSYIHAKAMVAQLLLESAWTETLSGNKEVKPWPWADTWPVARLRAPTLGISRIVLAGASGFLHWLSAQGIFLVVRRQAKTAILLSQAIETLIFLFWKI